VKTWGDDNITQFIADVKKLSLKKLFIISGSIAGAALFISVTITIMLLARNAAPVVSFDAEGPSTVQNSSETFTMDLSLVNRPPEKDTGGFLRPPERTNFLMVGLDNQLLTDAIMVGTFYRDSGAIHLMSIPRDLRTIIPSHQLEDIRAEGVVMPSPVKINAVRAFGGRERGIYYLKDILGEKLNVEFHYYIEVELSAFRRIVDIIGGVEMYIPKAFFYEDPYQDLFINIPAGLQTLNGSMAEGVIRFRSFPTGDLARNDMQMEFMSQLIRQSLTREAIMNDPLGLINIVLNDVRTNIGIDVMRYLPYLPGINPEKIKTFTMPGTTPYINGISWFVADTDLLPDTINQVFYANIIYTGEAGEIDDDLVIEAYAQ